MESQSFIFKNFPADPVPCFIVLSDLPLVLPVPRLLVLCPGLMEGPKESVT